MTNVQQESSMDGWGPLYASVKSEPWTCWLLSDDPFPSARHKQFPQAAPGPHAQRGLCLLWWARPSAPLLNVTAGIPRIRCSHTPCELLLCSPQREGAQAPSAQHRCGSPRAPARPGRALTGPRLFQHSCVGTAICTHGRADLGFSVSHSRADTD